MGYNREDINLWDSFLDGMTKESDEKKVKMFLALTDKQKKIFETGQLCFLLPNKDQRIVKDRQRRKKEKIKQQREEVLKEILEFLKPPTQKEKLLMSFVCWCHKKGLDLEKQTLGGKNYKKFIAELNVNCQATCHLAEKLIHLYKLELPAPLSFDTSEEYFSGIRWNEALIKAIQNSQIPLEDKRKIETSRDQAFADGWNKMCKELKKKKYRELFKKAE